MRRRDALLVMLSGAGLAACAPFSTRELRNEARNWRAPAPVPTAEFPALPPWPTWTDADGGYRFYPGDEIEFVAVSAPELNRNLVVAPDGRIHPPLVRPVMAADRTIPEVVQELQGLYATQLRNPAVTVNPRSFASQQIFVGGEVGRAGMLPLTGEMDPLQAVIAAGGFLTSAKREEVVVLRRGAGGQPFLRIFDLKTVFGTPNGFAGLPRLRRFDVVWVPRSRISETGLFTQQFVRDALPITIGFNYQIGNRTF
jgi:protein involved in polysaccharide export with SLBB domain